jgi:small subunit ribosomal protein S18
MDNNNTRSERPAGRNFAGRGPSDRPQRPGGPGGQKRPYQRKKVCRFCVNGALRIDYKDVKAIRYFVTERGKIVPRRISGNCARHQRVISTAVKRARNMALLPFTATSF